MSAQKPIGIFGVLVLVLLAAILAAGCGAGRARNQEKISETATTYLRTLADGGTTKACLQPDRGPPILVLDPAARRDTVETARHGIVASWATR
jgi:hypothetical protein